MGLRVRIATTMTVVALLFAAPIMTLGQSGEHPLAHPQFVEVWDRTDLPVQQGEVQRTWMWGPGANTPLMEEEYAEAADGTRTVQYTDKSRMELAVGAVPPDSDWTITQGLLATELMTGNLQLGDDTFEQHEPADIYVAGDPENNQSPTYAQMGELIDRDPRPTGEVITEILTPEGEIAEDYHLDVHGVTDQYYIEQTDKNIASVFWAFMNSTGTIYENGQFVDGDVFTNPFYAIGFPVTDAYWGYVTVDGDPQNVLMQCFERRCLTYAPHNDPGWQVESGNIGQHYYDWRYEEIDRPADDTVSDDAVTDDSDDAVTDDDDYDPVPGSIEIVSADADVDVGEEASVVVEVRDQHNNLLSGAEVTGEVISTTGDSGEHSDRMLEPEPATTGPGGAASLSYTGTESGIDTVEVEVDVPGLPLDPDDFRDTVQITWHATNDCVTEGESIQAAVDAAVPGDEVCIEAGVYEERVSIGTEDVTIVGKDGAVLDGSQLDVTDMLRIWAPEVQVQNLEFRDPQSFGVSVHADSVTLQQLDIENPGAIGVSIRGADHVEVSNINVFRTDGESTARGVEIWNYSTNIEVEDSEFDDVRYGFLVRHSDAVTLTNNRVTSTIWGIQLWHADTVTVDGVSVQHADNGINVRGEVNDVSIRNNELTENERGILLGIVGDTAPEIWQVRLTENRIAGNETGIEVQQADDYLVWIDQNRIVQNYASMRFQPGVDGTRFQIDDNDFENNSGSGLVHDGEDTLDARSNWWGAATGPGGGGDPVTGDVLVDPWDQSPNTQ